MRSRRQDFMRQLDRANRPKQLYTGGRRPPPLPLQDLLKRTADRKAMIKEEFSHIRPDAVHRQVLEQLLEEIPADWLDSVADEIERERAHRAKQIELFGSPDYWMEK